MTDRPNKQPARLSDLLEVEAIIRREEIGCVFLLYISWDRDAKRFPSAYWRLPENLIRPLIQNTVPERIARHKSLLHVANNSQSYMTDKIIWRRSFPNHFLIQHADRSDTCVVQNCHNLRRGNIRQTQCDFAQLKCLSRSFFLLERLIGLVFAPFLRPAPPTGLCRVETIQAGKVRLPFCGCPTNNCRRCDRIRDGRANVLRSVWSPIQP